jgi:hypothetical protein
MPSRTVQVSAEAAEAEQRAAIIRVRRMSPSKSLSGSERTFSGAGSVDSRGRTGIRPVFRTAPPHCAIRKSELDRIGISNKPRQGGLGDET